jgi:hypothetical protein
MPGGHFLGPDFVELRSRRSSQNSPFLLCWVNKGRRGVGALLGTCVLRRAAHRCYLLPHDAETAPSSEASWAIRFHSVPSAFITQRSVPSAPGAAGQGKAIFSPSGDQAGKLPEDTVVGGYTPLP